MPLCTYDSSSLLRANRKDLEVREVHFASMLWPPTWDQGARWALQVVSKVSTGAIWRSRVRVGPGCQAREQEGSCEELADGNGNTETETVEMFFETANLAN